MRIVVASNPKAVPQSDEEMLTRLRQGDRSAMNELFLRHRAACYRVAFRLLGNEADALDAVQNGFIKAFLNLAGFEGRSSLKTWLLRVVSNAALDLGRQRGRREERGLNDELDRLNEIAVPQVDPGWQLDRDDLRRLLDQALMQLPEAQRRTFVLHVDGGLSYREVAEALDISIGTVMSRLFYARQKLRAYLADRWPR
ncbi:MAG: RNA polymerase sigma factor [Gemmataceae bacterium]|nr:RNA polymerase sigma factor [Gemmataceae bacterium]